MIILDDKASKFLLLSGANFIDQNELNLLNLTPMFFIKTPSSNIYLEQTINENDDLIFYLLAVDKKKVINQLLDARHQTELRQILSEDILDALSVNSDSALQNIKANIENYRNALLEFEKCRERIIERYYPRICSLTSYDEIIVSTIVENEKWRTRKQISTNAKIQRELTDKMY